MIKEKLKRGTLIYKLYLHYHLFFRYKIFYKRKNYSQFDEDIFLMEFFKKKKKGKFVDLGAFHPIRYNNTYLLYRKGWDGTNIDLNQTSIDMFNIVRSRDNNKCALISNERNKKKTVYFEHNFSAGNSINLINDPQKTLTKEKIMNSSTFEDLVHHKFDFLNIDLEGHDYIVLKTIDLKYYQPDLICVEILENSKDKNKIFQFMEDNKFKLIKVCKVSHFFKNYESH
ncbi:FkbM family methyltransferase [Pelagibacterales bacterium SAG-MED29]|nr:FkbM family methyltransferase [Pelagibacterales bacterium SAG-MED29]|tara:strand:- start:526 stop:1206 length:681 start_codon:yes stop_codon:yes gene_type:complete